MLHPTWQKLKLAPDTRALYALTRHGKIPTPELADWVARRVRELRRQHKTVDVLAQRAREIEAMGAVQFYRKKLEELARMLYESKPLPTKFSGEEIIPGELRSVEIECVFPSATSETNFAIIIRKAKLSQFVTIKDDGSLRTNERLGVGKGEGGRCREVVVTFSYARWDILEKVCDALKYVRTYVNKSCGLHVHFDCRHMSRLQASRRASRIARVVPALRTLLPKSRLTNQYCQTVKNSFGDSNRYAFVNVHAFTKFKTLEIRGHSGTINFHKIKNWIRLIDIIAKSQSTVEVSDPMQMITRFQLPPDLADWVLARSKKFAKPTTVADDVVADEETA